MYMWSMYIVVHVNVVHVHCGPCTCGPCTWTTCKQPHSVTRRPCCLAELMYSINTEALCDSLWMGGFSRKRDLDSFFIHTFVVEVFPDICSANVVLRSNVSSDCCRLLTAWNGDEKKYDCAVTCEKFQDVAWNVLDMFCGQHNRWLC